MRHRRTLLVALGVSAAVLIVAGAWVSLVLYRSGTPTAQPSPAVGASWRVTSGVPPAELEQMGRAVTAAVAEHPVQLAPDESMLFEGVRAEGDWAVTGPVVRNTGSDALAVGETLLILLHRVDGAWHAAYPGTANYADWLDRMPETLLSAETKQLLR